VWTEKNGEDRELRQIIRDLVTLANVPAAWVGHEPQQIAGSYVDLLVSILRLDGAYVQLNGSGERRVQFSSAQDCEPFIAWLETQKHRNWTRADTSEQQRIEVPAGGQTLYLLVSPIGIHAEAGFIVTATYRPEYPTETEALLLSVAANQALISFRNYELLSEGARNEQVMAALEEQIDHASMFEEIVGSSAALRHVLARAERVAPTDTTVLILGETGTGKELIARAIHRLSKRSDHAIVSVNCSATPPSLIASELFGHEKGAFTGAVERRLGRFELAKGGTIFLDEIGELPAETQIALLRVLQEREFDRLGGTEALPADVRVIASTNRDLAATVSAGTFRMDLFYRLSVFPIELPPLRDRSEDIPKLIEYFVHRYARKLGKKITTVDKRTLKLFCNYSWPGNIRELQNVVERSVVLCDGEILSVDDSWLMAPSPHQSLSSKSLSERLQDREREIIEEVLAKRKGRIAGPLGAAAALGIPPSTLDSRIKNLKIKKSQFKPD